MAANVIPVNAGLGALGPDAAMAAPALAPAAVVDAPVPVADGVAADYRGADIPAATMAAAGLAPLGVGDFQTALNKVSRLQDYMQHSEDVATKAREFRTILLNRLRQVYWRLRTLNNAAGVQHRAALSLVALVQQINAAGGPTADQAAAMDQLQGELAGLRLDEETSGILGAVNQLAQALGLPGPAAPGAAPGGPLHANDAAAWPMAGGRRKKHKKRKKGGYKFTRAAISRRSLRMKTRKLKSLTHKKSKRKSTKHRKGKHHKRTKRRR